MNLSLQAHGTRSSFLANKPVRGPDGERGVFFFFWMFANNRDVKTEFTTPVSNFKPTERRLSSCQFFYLCRRKRKRIWLGMIPTRESFPSERRFLAVAESIVFKPVICSGLLLFSCLEEVEENGWSLKPDPFFLHFVLFVATAAVQSSNYSSWAEARRPGRKLNELITLRGMYCLFSLSFLISLSLSLSSSSSLFLFLSSLPVSSVSQFGHCCGLCHEYHFTIVPCHFSLIEPVHHKIGAVLIRPISKCHDLRSSDSQHFSACLSNDCFFCFRIICTWRHIVRKCSLIVVLQSRHVSTVHYSETALYKFPKVRDPEWAL